MTGARIRSTECFKAGGTLHLDDPSYITRPADDELFQHVEAGQFCYILTPRQMGKSSLMIRTAERLRQRGFQTAIIDLSALGIQATSEQWYLGIVKCLAEDLHLAVELEQWWREHGGISPAQRFEIFFQDVVLAQIAGPIVVFVDEIDSTLKLTFADDFFAVIRHIYNMRAHNPLYDRLTFVLLGVVAPTDLIKDRNRTPFNIGHAIDLQEFNRAAVGPLEAGLERVYPGCGRRIIDRIFYWTSGHPYLTQKLCREVAEAPAHEWTDTEVDHLVETLFLADDAQKEEDNLQFVNSNIEASPERRLLTHLYRRVYTGKTVKEDERSPIQNRLKLIGLVRASGGSLHVRNEIYRQVFNTAWINRNMPTNRLQVVTWLALTIIVITIVAVLGFAYRQRQETIALLKDKYLHDIEADEVGAQMYHLGQLCRLAREEGQSIFFEQTHRQQQKLFDSAVYTTMTSEQMAAMFDCLYPALDSRVQDSKSRAELSGTMCRALRRLNSASGEERSKNVCATGR